MTDRELKKLRRSELLEIMIAQKKDVAAAAERLEQEKLFHEATRQELEQLQETYERLRRKLDDKDEKIRELRDELTQERKKTAAAYGETEAIAAATERLNQALSAIEKAGGLFQGSGKKLKE